MPSQSNVGKWPIQGRERNLVPIFGQFTTNGSSAASSALFEGEVAAVVRDDVGDFTVTLKNYWPDVVYADAVIQDIASDVKVVSEDLADTAKIVLLTHTGDLTAGDTTAKVVQIVIWVRHTSVARGDRGGS